MRAHVISHGIVAVASISMIVAAFVGRTRTAAWTIRLPMILFGFVGILWSIIGMYLYSHDRDASHTLLPWAQYWALSHIKSSLGGVAVGILVTLLMNRDFYRRKPAAAITT
jgi:hypothetical protein